MDSKDVNMPGDKLDDLLKRYAEGSCNNEERLLVETWFEKYKPNDAPLSLKNEGREAMYDSVLQQLQEKGEFAEEAYAAPRFSVKKWAIAASVIFCLGAGGLFWYLSNKVPRNDIVKTKSKGSTDLLPGSNKATLTLANGSVIALNSVKTGATLSQGAAKIIKVDDGVLKYDAVAMTASEPLMNTITTELGGQYKVVLPDGSQVWLNSGSSLRFPEVFTGNERNVTLTGEAYFEVAKNKAMPFKVKVNDMTVQVLGTHFNVMAYGNEPAIKTTLLEGSVKIVTAHASGKLKPNEMASVIAGTDRVDIGAADIDKEVAWKNNLFWFQDASIQTVMNQLARWYDVDIKYEGTCKKLFNGTIPRNLNASKVLRILEQTGGVHFRIDGKAITVLP